MIGRVVVAEDIHSTANRLIIFPITLSLLWYILQCFFLQLPPISELDIFESYKGLSPSKSLHNKRN
jgi:hypothetical protein